MQRVDGDASRMREPRQHPGVDIERRRIRHAGLQGNVEHMAELGQHLALERVPTHSAAHSTGPERAYSKVAVNKVLGASIASAISTTTTISRAKNGTRSDFGPLPLPLKLL